MVTKGAPIFIMLHIYELYNIFAWQQYQRLIIQGVQNINFWAEIER